MGVIRVCLLVIALGSVYTLAKPVDKEDASVPTTTEDSVIFSDDTPETTPAVPVRDDNLNELRNDHLNEVEERADETTTNVPS